jgi:hypothetical protein
MGFILIRACEVGLDFDEDYGGGIHLNVKAHQM